MMTTLYLAHPHRSRLIIEGYAAMLSEETGVKFVNPFKDLGEKGDQIVRIDLEAIDKKCDGMLAFITGDKSVGTSMEIFYCYFVLKKPVLIYVMDVELADHQWLVDHGEVFTDLNELRKRLKEMV